MNLAGPSASSQRFFRVPLFAWIDCSRLKDTSYDIPANIGIKFIGNFAWCLLELSTLPPLSPPYFRRCLGALSELSQCTLFFGTLHICCSFVDIPQLKSSTVNNSHSTFCKIKSLFGTTTYFFFGATEFSI